MNDTYTRTEFAASYSMRGYGRKKDALKWLDENGIEIAHESAFEKCYHDLHRERIAARGRKWLAMMCDGQNTSAPSNMGNSRGKSFNALMMDAQREIDAADRAAKNMEVQDE